MEAIAQSTAARFAAGLVAAVMVLSSFSAFASTAQAATDVEELCTLAAALGISSPEFDALCGEEDDEMGSAMRAGETYYVHHPSVDFEFTRNLYIGARGNDVMMLQKVLNLNAATQIASTGAGSPGNETEYFGPATRDAVARFQAQNGISPASGYFYPITRAEMNRTAVASVAADDSGDRDYSRPSVVVMGDELIVREGDNPRDELMPSGVVRFPITAFELVAGDDDIDVEQVTVRYNGNAQPDEIIDSVVILDEDMNIVGDDEKLNSDDEADMEIEMTVEAGESMMFYVAVNASEAGDDFNDNDGLEFTMDVVDVESNASDVDGLPVSGAEMEVQDNIDLGSVEVDLEGTDSSFEVGEEEELFVKVEIDSKADDDDSVFVKSFRLENTGSGDLEDLENIYVEVDNEEFEGMIDESDDDYVVFDFGSGFELEDGDSETFEVRADAGTAAGDTYVFTIDEATDFYVESEAGYGMPIVAGDLTGPTITIGTGQVTLGDGEDEEAEKITVGNDIVIGLFDLEVEGEGFVADKLTLTINVTEGVVISGGTLDGEQSDILLSDVYIADENGNALTDKEDAEGDLATTTSNSVTYVEDTMTVEFDDVEFPVGDHENLQVLADIDDEVGSGTAYEIQLVNNSSFNDVEGADSGDDITVGSSAEFKPRTVEAAVLEVSVDSGEPSEDEVSRGSDQVEVAVVELDARDSGEDIAVSEFTLNFAFTNDGTGSSEFDEEEIDNCRLYNEDGDEVDLSDNVDIRSGTTEYEFQFEEAFVVEADSKEDVSVRCDIGSSVGQGTFTWSIAASDADVDAEGESTGNDDFAVVNDSDAKEITIVVASATVSQDSDTPDAQVVKFGADDVVLGIIEVEAEDGDITIDDISFELDMTGATADLLDSDNQINIFVGDVRQDSVDLTNATGTVENLNIDVNKDEKVAVTFTADIESSGTDGESVFLKVTDLTLEDGGTVEDAAQSFAAVTVYDAVPVLELESSTSNTLSASQVDYELFEFSVEADGDDLYVDEVVLDITTHSNIADFTGELYVYEDKSHTNEYGSDNEATASIAEAGTVTFSFPSDVQIDDGDTYYFVLKGDVTAENDPATITIELREDDPGVKFVDSTGAATIDSQEVMDDDFAVTHSYTN